MNKFGGSQLGAELNSKRDRKKVAHRRRAGVSAKHSNKVKYEKKYNLYPSLGQKKREDIYLAEFEAKAETDREII